MGQTQISSIEQNKMNDVNIMNLGQINQQLPETNISTVNQQPQRK